MTTEGAVLAHPPRKIGTSGWILLVLACVISIMLLFPSARDNRLNIAKRRFADSFPVASNEFARPLLSSHLIMKDRFVYDMDKKECVVLVFSPDSGSYYSAERMLNEASSPLNSYMDDSNYWQKVPVAILLAPEESNPGWTTFAKVWIAKILQKQKTSDLLQLGQEISTNNKSRARLQAIWKRQPEKIKKRATEILEENRKVGRQYRNSPRIYRNEATYKIDKDNDMSSFMSSYIESHPDKFPNYYR